MSHMQRLNYSEIAYDKVFHSESREATAEAQVIALLAIAAAVERLAAAAEMLHDED